MARRVGETGLGEAMTDYAAAVGYRLLSLAMPLGRALGGVERNMLETTQQRLERIAPHLAVVSAAADRPAAAWDLPLVADGLGSGRAGVAEAAAAGPSAPRLAA